MNFKIIETAAHKPDVLLYRDRDSDGKETIKILAIGVIDEAENMFAGETITLEDQESAINFIKDYSEFSANKWCDKNKITYSL